MPNRKALCASLERVGSARFRALGFLLLAVNGCAQTANDQWRLAGACSATPAITARPWGEVLGKPVMLYTLTNKNGLVLKVSNFGGVITELDVPDRTGKLADIVLGYDDLNGYVHDHAHFGAIIGRVANRISGARFELQGQTYSLAANDGKNSLHGGKVGWDKVVWSAQTLDTPAGPAVRLSYTSKDGEEGYPGTVNATNTYTLTNQNQLKVEMEATTDALTVVSMVHHTYWNLAGQNSGSVLDQELLLHATRYTPTDPTVNTAFGQIAAVQGTPFDFTTVKPIGRDLKAAGGDPIGYDANWIVDGDPNELREVLRVKDRKSGRVLTLSADQPGLQFYAGTFLDGSIVGKGGARYPQYSGFCIETQKFPNSVNVPAWQAQVVLAPGHVYRSTMIHTFTVE